MAPSSSTVGSTIAARQPALTLVEPWLAEPRAQTGGAFGSITIRMALPASWILPDRLTCSGPQMNADSHRPSVRLLVRVSHSLTKFRSHCCLIFLVPLRDLDSDVCWTQS